VFTSILALAVGYEKFSILKIVGVLCSVAGALTMVDYEHFELRGSQTIGFLMLLLQQVIGAVFLVFQRKLLAK
jgi:drug/metabolite transporter (DMT)-like permease